MRKLLLEIWYFLSGKDQREQWEREVIKKAFQDSWEELFYGDQGDLLKISVPPDIYDGLFGLLREKAQEHRESGEHELAETVWRYYEFLEKALLRKGQ